MPAESSPSPSRSRARPSTGRTTILTPEALDFVAALQREFGARRDELLAARKTRRDEVSRTGMLDFLPETRRSATATGGGRGARPTWSTAGSRSPGRPTAR